MNLFGRSKPSAAAPTPSGNSGGGNETSGAIAKLRDNLEMLQKREDHLVRKMDNEIKMAKEFSAKGKKREALTCIKRKKMYEKQCVGALELSRPFACSRPSLASASQGGADHQLEDYARDAAAGARERQPERAGDECAPGRRQCHEQSRTRHGWRGAGRGDHGQRGGGLPGAYG